MGGVGSAHPAGRRSRGRSIWVPSASSSRTKRPGRGAKKFLRGLGNVAAWSAAFNGGLVGRMLAAPLRFSRGPASQGLVVCPDGRFAYALDVKTNDVTVVDANAAEAAEKIGGGARELKLLTGGTAVAVVSGSEIALLDTASNKKASVVELPGLRSLVLFPDGCARRRCGRAHGAVPRRKDGEGAGAADDLREAGGRDLRSALECDVGARLFPGRVRRPRARPPAATFILFPENCDAIIFQCENGPSHASSYGIS